MLVCLKNISFEDHPSLKVKHGRKSRLLSFDTILVELAEDTKSMLSRSSYQKCSAKKLFLKISQYSQENSSAGVYRPVGLQLYKKDSNTGVFR